MQLLCRVMVVLVLCEAYTKLKRSGIATPHVVTQLHFYSFFVQAIVGKFGGGDGEGSCGC